MAALLLGVGCSGRPGRLAPPDIDSDDAADAAIEQLDANGDGQLDEGELAKSPALASAKSRYDADGSGALSAEEIAAGIRRWAEGKMGAVSVPFVVQWNGRPLDGVQVRLTPEPFLGDEAKGGVGEIERGVGYLTWAPEDRPSGAPNVPLIPPGLYRVEITHPSIQIPAKYNSSTTLGIEIAKDTLTTGGITWALTK
jgi:hypothetical protein